MQLLCETAGQSAAENPEATRRASLEALASSTLLCLSSSAATDWKPSNIPGMQVASAGQGAAPVDPAAAQKAEELTEHL